MAKSFSFNLQTLMNQANANAEQARRSAESSTKNLAKMVDTLKENFGKTGEETEELAKTEAQLREAQNLHTSLLRTFQDDNLFATAKPAKHSGIDF